MTKLRKYVRKDRTGSFTYYIREDCIELVLVDDFDGMEVSNLDQVPALRIMQFSEFAIDNSTNTFKKCRYPLEDLVEAYENGKRDVKSLQ